MKLITSKLISYLAPVVLLYGNAYANSFDCPTPKQVKSTNFDDPVKKGDGYLVIGKVAASSLIYLGIVEIHHQDNATVAVKTARDVIKYDELHDPVIEIINGNKQACVYYGNIHDKENPSVFVVNWGN